MFSLPPPTLVGHVAPAVHATAAAAASHSAASPVAAPPNAVPTTLSATLTHELKWRCGHAEYDNYIAELNLASDILDSLAKIDQKGRLKILRATFATKPDYPESWMEKCIQKHWDGIGRKSGGRPAPYQRDAAPPAAAPVSWSASSGASDSTDLTPRVQQSHGNSPSGPSGGARSIASPVMSHTSIGASVPRQLSSPRSQAAPPEWVVELRHGMNNRGMLLRGLFKQLDAERVARMSELGNQEQAFIAASIIFNPGAWQNVNEYVSQCVETLAGIDSQDKGVPKTITAAVDIRVVVLTVGYGIGLGHMALHAALCLPESAHLRLAAVYSFEVAETALAVEKLVAQGLGWGLHQCGDAHNLFEFVRQNSGAWEGCKILLLTRLPKPKTTRDSNESIRGDVTGLHKDGARLVFQISQVVQYFASKSKDSIVHLADIHPMPHTPDEEQLNDMFGKSFSISHKYYGATSRRHHFRTNVRLQDRQHMFKHLYRKMDFSQPQDGWKWSPDEAQGAATGQEVIMTSAPGSKVAQACAEGVFDASCIPPPMKAEIQMQQMTHVATGEKRLMSVKMWLHFLGLSRTVAADVIQQTHPCHGMILQVTGQAAPSGLPSAVPCGKGRWCNQCEHVLTLLGKCGHVPLMTDIIAVLLKVALEGWQLNNADLWTECSSCEAHACGPSCPHA